MLHYPKGHVDIYFGPEGVPKAYFKSTHIPYIYMDRSGYGPP